MKKDRSIFLSRIALWIFLILLAAFDLFCWPVCEWFAARSELLSLRAGLYRCLLSATVYFVSVPAYLAIFRLRRLLKNLESGEIFTRENTSCLRHTCWCLTAACAVFLLSAVYYVPFLILSLAAGFMALIVHIVKNVFGKALLMKDELDLTV